MAQLHSNIKDYISTACGGLYHMGLALAQKVDWEGPLDCDVMKVSVRQTRHYVVDVISRSSW